MGVGDAVEVGVTVGVPVGVTVGVTVGVGVGVNVGVGVGVYVGGTVNICLMSSITHVPLLISLASNLIYFVPSGTNIVSGYSVFNLSS